MGTRSRSLVSRLTAYALDEPAELVIPGDLTVLSDEELDALQTSATEQFDQVYGDGSNLSAEAMDALAALTEGIETIAGEQARRAEASAERTRLAAELAGRVHPQEDPPADDPDADADADVDEADEDADADENGGAPSSADSSADQPAQIAASGASKRINLAGVRHSSGRRQLPARQDGPRGMRDVVQSVEGEGLDWMGVGRAIDRSLTGFSQSQYSQAAKAGRHLRQQNGVVVFRREVPENLIINSGDPQHVEDVLSRARSEARLPGGSLVASGGWCAPSETLYGLCELESRDGLLTLPEVGVARGGFNYTTGPTFAELYAEITGFQYTEQQDIDGNYGVAPATGIGNDTAGDKPCYKVECPPFQEVRLGTNGLCITAGLLQSRGYPEMIARVTRGALIAHDHRMSAVDIGKIVAGSTPVTIPAGVGAAAPLLTAIEVQAEHIRYAERMARGTTLEAVFPYWVRGAIRSDLALRLGVELLDVPDSRIDGWFRSRGIAPQYVYDWQPLAGAPGSFTSWPDTVQFLLYPAGAWLRGVSDVITLDTLYDSVLLAQNDYTALFTEEGSLIAKQCGDSRVITVTLCVNGGTGGGYELDCNGVAAVA
jgi:hypothetical protein